VLYFTYGEPGLAPHLNELIAFIKNKNPSAGQLWRALLSYSDIVAHIPQADSRVGIADAVMTYLNKL